MTHPVSAADRLGLTVFLAAAGHGLLILGLGFSGFGPPEDPPQALDVVLLEKATEDSADDADYLANVASAGGGNVDQPARPRAPVSSPEPEARAGLAAVPLEAGAPRRREITPQPVVTAQQAPDQVATANEPPQQSDEAPRERPVERDFDAEAASLAAEIDQAMTDYAQRPRKDFVSARTEASAAAAYMHRWVETVEQVGNLNYPQQARNQGLSGTLVVTAAVRADGTIHEVRIRASSGSSVLDNAAKRILEQSEPFAAFPEDLQEETDILYITRTWEFASDELTTR